MDMNSKDDELRAGLYLLPVPLAPEATDTIPSRVHQILLQIRHFIVERTRTARRFIRKMAPDCVIDELEFAELDKHRDSNDYHRLLAPALEGKPVALLSEAGCPVIADPGSRLIATAHEMGIAVFPLVGPSSVLLALMASGMSGQAFCFHGYLPAKRNLLAEALRRLERNSARHGQTQIFIEAPYRNHQVLEEALKVLAPTTRLAVAADLTAPQETIRSATIKAWRTAPPLHLHKRPAVFVLSATAG